MATISDTKESYLCRYLAVQVQFYVNLLGGALGVDRNLLLLDVNLQRSGVNLGNIEGEEQFVSSLCPGDRSGALAIKTKHMVRNTRKTIAHSRTIQKGTWDTMLNRLDFTNRSLRGSGYRLGSNSLKKGHKASKGSR